MASVVINFNILVVDDCPIILELVKQTFGARYNVRTALSVQEAYEIMKQNQPDIILLDLAMPVIDGYIFLEHTRLVEKYKEIPIIVLTGSEDCDVEARVFEMGAADYLRKPIPQSVLERRVGIHLARLQQKRDLENQVTLSQMQLSVAMRTMRDVDERTRAMLDAAPFAICFWDREMRLVDCNIAAPILFGLSDKRDYIKNINKLSPDQQPCGTDSKELMKQHVALTFAEETLRVEWLYQNLKGEKIPCKVSLIRVPYNNDHLVVSYITDIRELKAAWAEREEAIRKAIEAAQAKGKFLAAMSHEIRTPMNAILGITESYIYNNDALSADVLEAFGRIYSSANSLLRVINDILDFSKIEANRMEILSARYDLPTLLIDAVQLNMMYLSSTRTNFKLTVDPDMPSDYIGDAIRIKQILNNLLSNAFKYTQEGEVWLDTCFERKEDSDEAVLIFRISDTGLGMSEAAIDKLFEAYTRFGEENHVTQGTGLGMSITKNLITMMNAEITVESEPDKGTRFCVRIPQLVADDAAIGKEIQKNLENLRFETITQTDLAQFEREYMPYGSVLVVDDIESNLYVACGLLSPYGIKVETADSGFAALEKIEAGKVYDIIFMDQMMPLMDGIETTRIIREKGYTGSIVALTANATAGQREMFLANGFDDFISKPVDTRHLNQILHRLVRGTHPEIAKQNLPAKRKEIVNDRLK